MVDPIVDITVVTEFGVDRDVCGARLRLLKSRCADEDEEVQVALAERPDVLIEIRVAGHLDGVLGTVRLGSDHHFGVLGDETGLLHVPEEALHACPEAVQARSFFLPTTR